MNSTVACTLDTDSGPVFLKAAEQGHPWAAQATDAAINPNVTALSPRLLLRVESSGWDALVFEFAPGRSADLRPNSSDLGLVADVMTALGELRRPSFDLPVAQKHFAKDAETEDLEHLAGQDLLHLDLNPDNIRVAEKALVVDWASPTVGAAWVDVAGLIVRLIDAGHTPESADRWARGLPAWRCAPASGITMQASVNARSWARIARQTSFPWALQLADSAKRWLNYRRRVEPSVAPGEARW
ncbi:phosphotransferase [Streptomyces sp. NPDC001933]|uniref:phosphotransferase n=1 Tax=Streptomyces sp. NPDC001933 TaxID=3364626 RepID=UPI00367507B1